MVLHSCTCSKPNSGTIFAAFLPWPPHLIHHPHPAGSNSKTYAETLPIIIIVLKSNYKGEILRGKINIAHGRTKVRKIVDPWKKSVKSENNGVPSLKDWKKTKTKKPQNKSKNELSK
jgi:hypothetical protein